MTRYRYKAVDPSGRVLHGTQSASHPEALEHQLSMQQLDLISYRAADAWSERLIARKISPAVVVKFFVELQQLVDAGISLIDGLNDMAEMAEHPAMQACIGRVVLSIEQGSTLSCAMSREHRVFDEVVVALVKAGEQSGQLTEMLSYIVDSMKWRDELMARSRKLMTYPLVTAVVVVAVTVFLLLWLVPRLIPFLDALGRELPWYTQWLVQASNGLSQLGLMHIVLPASLITCSLFFLLSARCRLLRDRVLLNVWLLGDLLQKIAFARFSRTLALLYSAGITLPDSLGLCADIMGNHHLKRMLQQVHDEVTSGSNVSDALAFTGAFPAMVKRMVRLGETTGRLDKALTHVSCFYDRQVQHVVDRVQTLLPVFMTLLLGALIALVMLAVLGPVYDAAASLRLY